jgi:maltose O-acetyltransferase
MLFLREKRIFFLVIIGKHCQINENVFIQGANIGDYVMIAPNVSILSVNHEHLNDNIPIVKQAWSENMPVWIRENVWIGRNAAIMPGCVIGEGVIVGAGAFVTKDIVDYAIVGGVPARVLKLRK